MNSEAGQWTQVSAGSLDLAILKEARALLTVAGIVDSDSLAIGPACAAIAAASALATALEASLRVAERTANGDGTSVGPFNVSAGELAEGLRKYDKLWWRTLHVPGIITGGKVSARGSAAVHLRTLSELIEVRNELAHGKGGVGEITAELEAGDGPPVSVTERQREDVVIEPGRRGFSIESPSGEELGDQSCRPAPWGLRWFQVTASDADRYIAAVEAYIDVCLVRPFRP